MSTWFRWRPRAETNDRPRADPPGRRIGGRIGDEQIEALTSHVERPRLVRQDLHSLVRPGLPQRRGDRSLLLARSEEVSGGGGEGRQNLLRRFEDVRAPERPLLLEKVSGDEDEIG